MKFIIIFILLIISNLVLSQTNGDISFYPLHIGDFWQYKGFEKDDIGRIKSEWIAYKKVVGDTILSNGKKYFVINENKFPTPNFSTGYKFIRIDSTNGNIYGMNVDQYEIMIDSLNSQNGDLVKKCFISSLKDTLLLGVKGKIRKIRPICISSNSYSGFDLFSGIGETMRYYDDIYVTWIHYECNLVYAKINGKEFGTYLKNSEENFPTEIMLNQNFPNPFNPTTVIRYTISPINLRQGSSNYEFLVTLKVYDLLGKEVVTLVDEYQKPGIYNYQFSISNYQLTSGIYFYRLNISNTSLGSIQVFSQTKKMVFIK